MSPALRRTNLFYIIWLVSIAALNLQAEEPDSTAPGRHYFTDPVVITSGKFPVRLSESPYRVEVLDAKKIDASNGVYIADVLKNTSSVVLRSYGAAPLLQTASINGMSPEHTVVLIDGVRINSFQNSLVDLSLINTEFIDNIELISGGASSLYGSNAMGGVVNIITQDGGVGSGGIDAKAEAGYGPFDARSYLLAVGGRNKSIGTRFYVSNRQSDNMFEYFYDDGSGKKRKKRENAAYLLRDMGFMLSYTADPSALLKLNVLYTNQDKQLPGIETGTPPPKTEQPDKALNAILSFDKALSRSSGIKLALNYQNSLQKYRTLPFINTFYKNDLAAFSGAYHYDSELIKAAAGYDYSHGRLISKELVGDALRNQHALFLSSSFRLPGGLSIFPSARIDNYSDLRMNIFTGRTGVTFKPFEENLVLRASIGNNFRAPTFNDLYWKNGGNPLLKPERSMNIDGGARYNNVISEFLVTAEAGYNYIVAEEKIVWAPAGGLLWSPKNISSSVSHISSFSAGADYYGSGALSYGASTGISFNTTTDEGTGNSGLTKGKQLIYMPLVSSNVMIYARFRFIKINIIYNHIGKRYSDQENKNTMAPVNLLGGNISFDIPAGPLTAAVRFGFDNITDSDYEVISGYPMPLRNYSFNLSINYNHKETP